MVDLLIFGV